MNEATAIALFPDAQQHWVTCADGTRLCIYSRGEGPSIICLHGWCGSAMSYADASGYLAEAGYRVIVPDLRGYGRSDKPDSAAREPDGPQGVGYDASAMATDVATILDALGVATAHVVGHDMGAPVALRFAYEFPQRTQSVCYVDEPLIGFNSHEMTAFSEAAHGGFWQFGLNYAPGVPEVLYTGRGYDFIKTITDLMTYSADGLPTERIRYHALGMDTAAGVSGWVGWYRAVGRTAKQMHEISEAGGIDTPLLALAGKNGVATVPDQMGPCANNVRGELINNCGHLVMEEQPREFAHRLISFYAPR